MYSARYSCQIFIKLEFSQILEKYSNVKFHEHPSSVSRVFPCGRTDGRTDITKLTDALLNFAKAPKITQHINPQSHAAARCGQHDSWIQSQT